MDIVFRFENDGNENKKLSEVDKKKLDESLTLDELTNAMKRMQLGRTPGCDGFLGEVFRKTWEALGPLLLNAYNYAVNKGELHLSARRGVINLIPKKDKDGIFLKNWRPLTLLNVDYKILAKALALKLLYANFQSCTTNWFWAMS